MLPILYDQNSSDNDMLTTNGLGFVAKCIHCEVSKVVNGVYEMEMFVQTTDRLANEIVPQTYVKCKPNNVENPQLFRVYEVVSSNNIIQVKCEHIRYRMSDNAIIEKCTSQGTPQSAWDLVQDILVDGNHGFEFSSDITTNATVTAAKNSPIRFGEYMLGAEGSILDAFGGEGEYDFDNFVIYFNKRKTEPNGICLRLGAGIDDIEYFISCQNQYTHVMPVAGIPTTDGGTWYIIFPTEYTPAIPMEIPGSTLLKKRILMYDFTETFKQQYPNFTCTPSDQTSRRQTESLVVSMCSQYIQRNATSLKYPRVNVKIQTRSGTDRLKNCKVRDIIQVYHEKLNLTLSVEIIKTVYDVLNERYTSIELGTPLTAISKYFSNKNIGGL